MPDRFNITGLSWSEEQYSCSMCILTCYICHFIQTIPCTTVSISGVQDIRWKMLGKMIFLLRNTIYYLHWKTKEDETSPGLRYIGSY